MVKLFQRTIANFIEEDGIMSRLPNHFQKLQERYGPIIEKLNNLSSALSEAGPIDHKTGHLIHLAAAATQRSEGAVHSHARRALEAGASPDEIRHAVLLLTSTIGFPTVSAALSWVDDVLEGD
jgi:AhpD family alkylhydroperoxidase